MTLFSTSPCHTGPSLLLHTPVPVHTHIFNHTCSWINFYCRLDKEPVMITFEVLLFFYWGPIQPWFISLNQRLIKLTIVGSKVNLLRQRGEKMGLRQSLVKPEVSLDLSSLNSRFTAYGIWFPFICCVANFCTFLAFQIVWN